MAHKDCKFVRYFFFSKTHLIGHKTRCWVLLTSSNIKNYYFFLLTKIGMAIVILPTFSLDSRKNRFLHHLICNKLISLPYCRNYFWLSADVQNQKAHWSLFSYGILEHSPECNWYRTCGTCCRSRHRLSALSEWRDYAAVPCWGDSVRGRGTSAPVLVSGRAGRCTQQPKSNWPEERAAESGSGTVRSCPRGAEYRRNRW